MSGQTSKDTDLQEKLAADPHRPQYHFLPPAGWMNDPNGLLLWQDKYHLFYQHNPEGGFPGRAHWGHAVSKDLVHWSHLPIALTPTPGGPDEGGCWSGSAVDNNGVPTILYTGVDIPRLPRCWRQVQCLATSTDGMITWKKHPKNPAVGSPPPGLDVTDFRDPCVWKEGDTWYMLIGAGIEDVGATAFLYRSKNLVDWQYLHPLWVGEPVPSCNCWECPDFFPLGDKHVLLVSAMSPHLWISSAEPCRSLLTTLYYVGTYADHKFTPEVAGTTDFGGHFYAAKTLLDDRGWRIMWGWVWEARGEAAQRAAGWSGVQSLPRLVSLAANGTLRIEPAPELAVLRGEHQQWANLTLTRESPIPIEGTDGDCLEIMAEFEPGDGDECGMAVRLAPDGSEQTLIVYSNRDKHLRINRERSTLDPDGERSLRDAPLALAADQTLRLHVFLDRSVLEVFANGRTCLTSRIYPTRADSLGVGLFAGGGEAKLKSLDVWQMKSIWPARK